MPRPRRIPSTVYPAGAELRYFQALRKEIVDWFTDLTADLQSIYQRRMDARPDEILGQISEQLQQIKSTAARAESRLKRQEAMSAVNAARARWQQAEANLMRAVGETADIVNRLSDRSVQNQIDAALTNRKLRVQNGQPMFGELQAEIDTFTQNNALLIKDIGEKAAREISYIVQNAVGESQKWESIAPLIKKRLDVTEARAALIAQNQTARLETQLSTIRAESSGAVAFEWKRTSSINPRSSHAIKVGKVYPIDSSPKPREEPNCKCGMRFVWPGDELLKQEAPRHSQTWDNPPPEKQELKRRIIDAQNSSSEHDRVLGELAEQYFDKVVDINKNFYNENGKILAEIDLILDDVLIEVTTGKAKHKDKQYKRYSSLEANPRQLPVVLFTTQRIPANRRGDLSKIEKQSTKSPPLYFVIENGLKSELDTLIDIIGEEGK